MPKQQPAAEPEAVHGVVGFSCPKCGWQVKLPAVNPDHDDHLGVLAMRAAELHMLQPGKCASLLMFEPPAPKQA